MRLDRRRKFLTKTGISLACVLTLVAVGSVSGQRLAVLTPELTGRTREAAEIYSSAFREKFTVMDADMAEAAFRSARPETPFNMTDGQAKAVAAVIGCDAFLLVKSETLRRSSLERPEYYEAYVVVYVINGRNGQLANWDLASFEEPNPASAEKHLSDSLPAVARSVAEKFSRAALAAVPTRPQLEEITEDAGPADLKPPIPYRRIKPEYPKAAYLFRVKATVEVEADIDENGKITRTAVVRWAGFGLDEAAVDAVRAMNWRPAMRGGKPLPMRVLLRYNFTKIEKD